MEKLNVIEFLVKNSAAFQCKHITMKRNEDRVEVRSTSTNFHATELIGDLGQFSQFLKVENNEVVLVIF